MNKYARCFVFPLVMTLTACLQSATEKKSVSIPRLQLTCHPAQSDDCLPSKGTKSAYVGLTSNSVNCREYLLKLPGDQDPAKFFDAFGQASLSVNGDFITGWVFNWYDSNLRPMTQLTDGLYTACAYIDLNRNGRADSSDLFGEGQVDTGRDYAQITNWHF